MHDDVHNQLWSLCNVSLDDLTNCIDINHVVGKFDLSGHIGHQKSIAIIIILSDPVNQAIISIFVYSSADKG